MFLWVILFAIILIISFILALKSMSDYHEIPSQQSLSYSVFLIQKTNQLTTELLDELYHKLLQHKAFVSFERLFKGKRNALVVYGPVSFLIPYQNILGLLELEDYSMRIDSSQTDQFGTTVSAWEVGVKIPDYLPQNVKFDEYLPELSENDEFWWQVVAMPVESEKSLIQNVLKMLADLVGRERFDRIFAWREQNEYLKPIFKTVIRAVFITSGQSRLRSLQEDLSKVGYDSGLAALPSVYSSMDIIRFYQKRSFPIGRVITPAAGKKDTSLMVGSQELLSLVGIKE